MRTKARPAQRSDAEAGDRDVPDTAKDGERSAAHGASRQQAGSGSITTGVVALVALALVAVFLVFAELSSITLTTSTSVAAPAAVLHTTAGAASPELAHREAAAVSAVVAAAEPARLEPITAATVPSVVTQPSVVVSIPADGAPVVVPAAAATPVSLDGNLPGATPTARPDLTFLFLLLELSVRRKKQTKNIDALHKCVCPACVQSCPSACWKSTQCRFPGKCARRWSL